MQYRDYKEFFEGGVYHIYNRGHNKMTIFREDKDYSFFLQRLTEILNLQPTKSRWLKPLPIGSFAIFAYCLMPNHFHIMLRQETKISVSVLIGKLLTSYCIYFNKKYNLIGPVFQDSFKSKEIDNDEYLIPLSAYIHRNPSKYLSWPFSSLSSYLGKSKELLVDSDLVLSTFNRSKIYYEKYIKDYKKYNNKMLIEDLAFEE